MFNPLKYVENNFEDKNLSDAGLRSFSEDHLVRLTNPDNNPGGIYNTLITDTTTKYNAYYGKITNKAVKKAIAEGTTVTRNAARKAAEDKISNIQDLVKYKFLETSAQYQELYPLGMFEYYQAKEGDVGTLFDRFVEAATTHLNADFPAEVTAIDGLVDAFHSAYTARETVMSQVDNLITGKNDDREALTFQLTKNFLTIAINNIGKPGKFDDYYDPRFLPLTSDSGSGITLPFERSGTLALSVATTIDLISLDATTQGGITFTFQNSGTTTMRHYSTDSATGLPGVGAMLDVMPGTVVTKTLTELIALLRFDETKHFLGIQNIGPIGTGNYKVTISV